MLRPETLIGDVGLAAIMTLWKLLVHPAVWSIIGGASTTLTLIVTSALPGAIDSMTGASGGEVAITAGLHAGAHSCNHIVSYTLKIFTNQRR